MSYLLTWTEGDEVFYKLVPAEQVGELFEVEKHFIVTELGPDFVWSRK
ncbi:hypothetical protein [Desulfolucanica intricata]|nr:hypothetical protein [Desulfolucanica intricata]